MSLVLNESDRKAAISNSDLEKIDSWAKQWKVSFNEEKTELLTFKKDSHPVYSLSFGNIVHRREVIATMSCKCPRETYTYYITQSYVSTDLCMHVCIITNYRSDE